jgi:hypothetical protein
VNVKICDKCGKHNEEHRLSCKSCGRILSSAMQQEGRYKWIIESDAEGIEVGWGCSDIFIIGLLFLLYIAPAVIYIGVKWYSQNAFNKRMKESHEKAFEITRCVYLAQFMHLGGHPLLPYRNWVLVGLKGSKIFFYDLYLEELHSAPISSIKFATDTRHASATSFGNAYSLRDTNHSVSTSTTSINMHPDTIIMYLSINGEEIQAVFDGNYYDPLEFVQAVNKIRTSQP